MEKQPLHEVKTLKDAMLIPFGVKMDDVWKYCIREGIPLQMLINRTWIHVRLIKFDTVHRQFWLESLEEDDNSIIYLSYQEWRFVKIPYIKEIVMMIKKEKMKYAEKSDEY